MLGKLLMNHSLANIVIATLLCTFLGVPLAISAQIGLGLVKIDPLAQSFVFWFGVSIGLLNGPWIGVVLRRKKRVAVVLVVVFVSDMILTYIAGTFGSIIISLAVAEGVLWIGAVTARSILQDVLPPGYCSRCSYDLRGSSVTGRCPECGQSFAPTQPQDPAVMSILSL